MTGKIDQITALLKMIPLHRNDGFSTKDEAQFFKQLHLKIHGDRQMEAEGEYSPTVQYKAKWKNSRNEISIDRFSYQRFPDPPGEGWPALWTDRPNPFFSTKRWSQWTWPLFKQQHQTVLLKTHYKDCVGCYCLLIEMYSNWCLPTHSLLSTWHPDHLYTCNNHTGSCF